MSDLNEKITPLGIAERYSQTIANLGHAVLLTLKVPKRENFSLAFFALSEPIWVCDLGTGDKNRIFYQLTPDFDSFWFFAAH